MDSVTSLLNLARFGLIAFDSQFGVVSMNLRASEMLGSIYASNFTRWVESVREKIQSNQDSFECNSPLDESHLNVLSLQLRQRGHLLLLQDITRQKTLEEQFIIAEKMSAFGRIAGGLAHETGTPLNIISGRAEILQALPDSLCQHCAERARPLIDKHISVIFQQIERISGIIQQLLAQTKEEEQQARPYSINDCVKQAADFVKSDMDRDGIHLEMLLAADLPELHGFPDQIRHVLLHLLLNAKDAVQGKAGVIEVATLQKDARLLLSVRDNGAGIPRENLTRIFDPFFTTKEFGKGTGLGLSVASSLVHAHGGRIDVESQVGQGTRFLITLPIR
jgi:signal transduction histidine kinase